MSGSLASALIDSRAKELTSKLREATLTPGSVIDITVPRRAPSASAWACALRRASLAASPYASTRALLSRAIDQYRPPARGPMRSLLRRNDVSASIPSRRLAHRRVNTDSEGLILEGR